MIGGVNSNLYAYGNIAGDVCTGRLTLSSTDPCPAGDILAATTLYFLPYKGRGMITLLNAVGQFETWSIPTGGINYPLTGLTANKNIDVFVCSSGSNLIINLIYWTNDTTRDATYALQHIGDYWYPLGFQTYRYVGTIRTTATIGQCEDSLANRLVWNMHNQTSRKLYSAYAGSWSLTKTGTFTQPTNGSATNVRFSFISGHPSTNAPIVTWFCFGQTYPTNAACFGSFIAASIDQTSGWTAYSSAAQNNILSGLVNVGSLPIYYVPTLGYHWVTGLDQMICGTSGTAAWALSGIYGDIIG